MPRLFLATFLDHKSIAKLNSVVECKMPEQLHLTWLFLGEVEEAKIEDIVRTIEAVKTNLFIAEELSLTYDQLELWPKNHPARLAVLTVSKIPALITNLAQELHMTLAKFIADEKKESYHKKFTPHITVRRFSRNRNKLPIEQIEAILPIHQVLNNIVLVKSVQINDEESGNYHQYEFVKTFEIQ